MLWFAGEAMALQQPRPIATDRRIQTLRYSPNEVYKFTGHYGYQSSIEFAPDELIQTISVGDSVSWLINPTGHRLFIKPIEQDATTNMTVITDKRTYLFELHARETENIRDRSMVFVVRFIYPEDDLEGFASVGSGGAGDSLPDPAGQPQKYNFNYSLRGSEVISPIRIFDDGEFTYFEFRNKNADVPAFFRVDSVGNEEVINFRKQGDYIIVERVASRFTLRMGPEIVCVYNEAMPPSAPPAPPPGFFKRVGNSVGL